MPIRYRSFTIYEYRGITTPIQIDISKAPLIPIIGINECGKTTILEALFALDELNDNGNQGHHLSQLSNLFQMAPGKPRVGATLSLSWEDFESLIDECMPEVRKDETAFLKSLGVTLDSESAETLINASAAIDEFEDLRLPKLAPAEQTEKGELVARLKDKREKAALLVDLRGRKKQFPGAMDVVRDLTTKIYSDPVFKLDFALPIVETSVESC